MDFSGTQFLCLVLTFYISLQIALNDFVISEVQLNLKPSNSRTHIEPNQSELKTENRRTELKFSALVKNSNQTTPLLLLEPEQNRTLAVRVLSHL